MNEQTWEELSSRRIDANIATWNARERWHASQKVNTFNKTDEEMREINEERDAARADFERCHAEALKIADAANAAYRW
jgi:cell division septum initiation protein DivIVA